MLAKDLAEISDIERIFGLKVLAIGIKRGKSVLEHLRDRQGVNVRPQLGLGIHLGPGLKLEGLDHGRLDQGGDDLELVVLERNVDHCWSGERVELTGSPADEEAEGER